MTNWETSPLTSTGTISSLSDMRQAIMLTNDSPVECCIYVSRRFNELIKHDVLLHMNTSTCKSFYYVSNINITYKTLFTTD